MMQNQKNNAAPRLSVEATVVTKRTEVSSYGRNQLNRPGYGTYHNRYYATFQVASGDRMELMLSGSDYGLLAEGDYGILTFQGTRFIQFERRQ